MRPVFVALVGSAITLSLACTGTSSTPTAPSAQPASVPPTVDAEPTTADKPSPQPQADLSAACGGADPVDTPEQYSTPGGRTLYIVACEMYAYQGTFEIWRTNAAGQPVRELEVLGYPGYDEQTHELTNFSKDRGVGDCGTWHKWTVNHEAIHLVETRQRECSDTPPDTIDPSSWPLVGQLPSGTGHCAGETTYFSCHTAAGQEMALCGDASRSRLQYRFGPPGAPELLTPSTADMSQFGYAEASWVRAQATSVSVNNNGYLYALIDKSCSGHNGEGELNNFLGVVVMHNGEELARKRCADQATAALDTLQDHLRSVGYLE